MGKVLILLLVAIGVWFFLRGLRNGKRDQSARIAQDVPPETMVACARCGLNQPRSESIASNGTYYCCEAHRQADEERS
ncbi:MAG: hypothetical protein L6Q60_12790 [Rhodocyclaceae bacterium]|nr:hypothetical protein [Rhodocyclaceae bacterium]